MIRSYTALRWFQLRNFGLAGASGSDARSAQAAVTPIIATRRIKKTLLHASSLNGVDDRPQGELLRVTGKLISTASAFLRARNAPSDESIENLLEERQIPSSTSTQCLGSDPLARTQVCEFNERANRPTATASHEHDQHLVDMLIRLSGYRENAKPMCDDH